MRESKHLSPQAVYNRLDQIGEYSGQVIMPSGEVYQVDFVQACELEMLHGAEIVDKENVDAIRGRDIIEPAMGESSKSSDPEGAGNSSPDDSGDSGTVHTRKRKRAAK